MSKLNYVIAIIEDDPILGARLQAALSTKYERVELYKEIEKADDALHRISPDIILMDMFVGDENGLDALESIRKQGYKMPVVIMASFADIRMAMRAIKLGADDFIVKPLDMEQVELIVDRTINAYILKRKVAILSEQLKEEIPGEILGSSAGVRKALDMAKIFAKADDTTVLILGESGTGKELFARFIHDNSPRAKGPFITINCGAIPRELAENELFGYERGAFTGATEKIKQGKFEQAHHGTILLDEIGELSLELQVKLLRALQEKKYYRLGGSQEVNIDVRVIASTNRDLEKLVEEEKFREDLFYRLNVARISLPPLRERGEDIMNIATAYIDKFNKKFGRNISGFTQEAADILLNHKWRGNVRELANIIERVVLLEPGDVINKESVEFLKTSTLGLSVKAKEPEIEPGGHYLKISPAGSTMEKVVKDLILQTLNITNGNQIKAAKLLGISRAKLRYRIEQYKIEYETKILN